MYEIADTSYQSGFAKEQIEKFAEVVANSLNYKVNFKNLENVIESLHGKIEYTEQEFFEDDGQSGSMIVRGPSDFTIFLSNTTSRLRDNFTIAHELGHYILHSDFGKKPAVFKRCGSDRLEWEANWFAGAFLMPEEEFKKVFLENNMSVLLTAAYFDVSEKAVRIRKDRLGL